MSNVVFANVNLSTIPQASTGVVPVAQRYVFGPATPAGVAANRMRIQPNLVERPYAHAVIKQLTNGAHATITASLEASMEGVNWISLAGSLQSQAMSGLTFNQNGVSGAVALFLAGLVLPFPGGFPYYRVGLAGDSATTTGTAVIGWQFIRTN